MKVKIYRGTHEIGGTCIKLTAKNGKTLLIDFGSPLGKENPNIDYAQKLNANAVLISHAHQDHCGLLHHLNSNTHIFLGSVTLDLINTVKVFTKENKLQTNITTFLPWNEFTIDNTFKVFPYLTDHSSPEAFAFTIEADNKRIFYSGDFRATGYKKSVYYNLIKSPPKNIDLLFVEGTMVQRDNHTYKTEYDIYNAFDTIFKNQENASFVISSAQNIDRFVSVYKACKKNNKTVIIDIYNAMVLDAVKKQSKSLPIIDWENIKVYLKPSQLNLIKSNKDLLERLGKNNIKRDSLIKPENYVYFLREPNKAFVNTIKEKGGLINLLFSQWEGYLQKDYAMYFTDYINELKSKNYINFKHIHTSGHATIDKLLELAKSINPKQIVPIHTDNPERMKKYFNDNSLINISVWNDNVEYLI